MREAFGLCRYMQQQMSNRRREERGPAVEARRGASQFDETQRERESSEPPLLFGALPCMQLAPPYLCTPFPDAGGGGYCFPVGLGAVRAFCRGIP